jgi:hypothetical protein
MSKITINSEIVLNACGNYFEARSRRIKNEHEELITKQMTRSLFNWFPSKTREGAIEHLKTTSENGFSTYWEAIEWTGSRQCSHMERLHNSALLSSTIILDDDDIYPITQWADKEVLPEGIL